MSVEIPDVGRLAGLCYWDGSAWQKLDSATWAGLLTELQQKLEPADLREYTLRGACYPFDSTVSVETDLDVITYASGTIAKIHSLGISGDVMGQEDCMVLIYTYDSAGSKVILNPHYSHTIAALLNPFNPFYEATGIYVPNCYHVSRYVDSAHWTMRILFSTPLMAAFGFGLRFLNATAASRRFYGAVIYEVED